MVSLSTRAKYCTTQHRCADASTKARFDFLKKLLGLHVDEPGSAASDGLEMNVRASPSMPRTPFGVAAAL